jgi:hypothetical protein
MLLDKHRLSNLFITLLELREDANLLKEIKWIISKNLQLEQLFVVKNDRKYQTQFFEIIAFTCKHNIGNVI